MSLSIIIPAYNETNQIDLTVKKLNALKKKINNHEIIFIDDFSEDNTYQKLKKIEKAHNRIRVFKNKKMSLEYKNQKKKMYDCLCAIYRTILMI